jgi:predicted ester cyclase
MSAQQNEAIARRYAELFGAGDLDALAEELFLGLHLEVEGLVAVDDEAVARATFSGEHTGEFQGIPPTGREVRFGGMAWFRIDGEGKIVEHWGQFDAMGMMQQLGVMEAPSA